MLSELMPALAPHADRLGCRDDLEDVTAFIAESGSEEQQRVHRERGSLPGLVEFLADAFCVSATATA